jgi:hypothetical protein
VRIEDSHFLGNAGPGLLIDGGKGPVSNVKVMRNVFAGNARSIKLKHAVVAASCGNRLRDRASSWAGLDAFVDAIKLTVAQNDCVD